MDNEYHPCPIEGGGTVDEIVREPDHKYVAVIGGDVHNYQRYSAKVLGRDELLHYFVSGGAGAYMHATHKIPRITLPGVDEDGFVWLSPAGRLTLLLQHALRPPIRRREGVDGNSVR